jgi:predicted HicB family RNase H-like nuclease
MSEGKNRKPPRSVRFSEDVETWLRIKAKAEDISVNKKINRIVKQAKDEDGKQPENQ